MLIKKPGCYVKKQANSQKKLDVFYTIKYSSTK